MLTSTSLNRVIVLGLDGTPKRLIEKRMAMRPNSIWHKLVEEGSLVEITSSRPEVSSVAWASYLTGANPGEHGLFGFVDRTLNPFRMYFPNGASLKKPTLLERVHDAGGSVVSINVPATFPPQPLRGLVVGGFLGVRLETNVQPESWLPELRRLNYVIDVDPALAYKDKGHFLRKLHEALDARVNLALKASEEINWNLLQLHIMETDRLYHFFWDDPGYEEQFHGLLDKVDEAVERFYNLALKDGAKFVLLSDHGFTKSNRIFFINAFLKQNGLLSFNGQPSLNTISPSSRAYALVPGRVFISLQGREPFGTVKPGADYEMERQRVAGLLRDVRDPLNGQSIFEKVVFREELYSGPHLDRAADIIALPNKGIDIKADFNAEPLFETPSTLLGTHTFDDAFFYIRGEALDWKAGEKSVADVGQKVADLIGLVNESGQTLLH